MNTINHQNNDRFAWKTLRTYSILMTVGSGIAIFAWLNKYSSPSWHWPLAFSASVCFLLYILKQPSMSMARITFFYFAIALFNFLGALVSANHILRHGHNTILFEVYKFIALVVAFLAPYPRAVGYVLIGLCCLLPPLQVLLTPNAAAPGLYVIEPWVTMAYALGALVILRHRLETRQLEISLAELKAKEKSWSDFADVIVALRDLTGTPVQSLEILVDLLKNEKITSRQAGELLEKEVYKIKEISEIFAQHQSTLIWKQGTESVDSLAVLRQKLSSYTASSTSRQ